MWKAKQAQGTGSQELSGPSKIAKVFAASALDKEGTLSHNLHEKSGDRGPP